MSIAAPDDVPNLSKKIEVNKTKLKCVNSIPDIKIRGALSESSTKTLKNPKPCQSILYHAESESMPNYFRFYW